MPDPDLKAEEPPAPVEMVGPAGRVVVSPNEVARRLADGWKIAPKPEVVDDDKTFDEE